MRLCHTCKKVGPAVETDCPTGKKRCGIISRGWRYSPPGDFITEQGNAVFMDNGDTLPGDADPAMYGGKPSTVEVIPDPVPGIVMSMRRAMEEEAIEEVEQLRHTDSGTVAGSILREAAGIVDGARNQTHGDKERSFEAIGRVWTAYLFARRRPNDPIRPHDVAHMMVLMKQQRAEWGEPVRDHFVDGAGYSAIAGELAPREEEDF